MFFPFVGIEVRITARLHGRLHIKISWCHCEPLVLHFHLCGNRPFVTGDHETLLHQRMNIKSSLKSPQAQTCFRPNGQSVLRIKQILVNQSPLMFYYPGDKTNKKKTTARGRPQMDR